MDNWQTIDTAQKVPQARILLWDGRRVFEGWWGSTRYDRSRKDYNDGWVDHPGHEVTPTHWMPLPAPPTNPIPKGE